MFLCQINEKYALGFVMFLNVSLCLRICFVDATPCGRNALGHRQLLYKYRSRIPNT